MQLMRLLLTLICLSISVPLLAADAISVRGRLLNGSGVEVALLATTGEAFFASPDRRGRFAIAVPKPRLAGATIQLLRNGRYMGPLVLDWSRDKVSVSLSGVLQKPRRKILDLRAVRLADDGSFARVLRRVALRLRSPVTVLADRRMRRPLGAGSFGQAVAAPTGGDAPAGSTEPGDVVGGLDPLPPGSLGGGNQSRGDNRPLKADQQLGADQDNDGIPNQFDVDDDGDGVLDAFDAESAATSARTQPFTTLYLGMDETINANVTGELTQAQIDAVIGGENLFALILYSSLAPDDDAVFGRVICTNALVYCRRGDGTAVYSGVSESSTDILGQNWVSYSPDGSGFPNLELIDRGGNRALVAAVQPRVGSSAFRAGDVFRIELTSNDGRVTQSAIAVIPPYFVSVPTVARYDSGGGPQRVDYASGGPASISLTAGGRLTLEFWRPQRLPLPAESGNQDMGHLHYGLLLRGQGDGREFTCGGFYSGLSENLRETAALGSDGSPFAQNGANLWPLSDSEPDRPADPARVLTLSVDVRGCLARVGQSGGTYQATLTAAGEMLTGGANRAAQTFQINAP